MQTRKRAKESNQAEAELHWSFKAPNGELNQPHATKKIRLAAKKSESDPTKHKAPKVQTPKRKQQHTQGSTAKKPTTAPSGVVWVFDEEYQWWPGQVDNSLSSGQQIFVNRFGDLPKEAIRVSCSANATIDFDDAKRAGFEALGMASSKQLLFVEAMKAATLADDDDLPSLKDALESTKRTGIAVSSHFHPNHNQESGPDLTVTIPGELVLAKYDGKTEFWPGKVESYSAESNKYEVLYASGHRRKIRREWFYTSTQNQFSDCPLGQLEAPKGSPASQDRELQEDIRATFPILRSLWQGSDDKAHRVRDFKAGGKAMKQLAQRVSYGSLVKWQQDLLIRILQQEFAPELLKRERSSATSAATLSASSPSLLQPGLKSESSGVLTAASDTNAWMDEASDMQKSRFILEVLVPEAITRFTMHRNSCSYDEANTIIHEESKESKWVEDILATRQAAQDGKEAIRGQ